GRESTIRRSIRVAHDDRRDGLEGNRQLLGNDLLVGGMRGGLTKIDPAGSDEDRVVSVDFEPRTGRCGVERILSGGCLRRSCPEGPADQAEPNDEGAARPDELTTGKRGPIDVSTVFLDGRHLLPRFRHEGRRSLHCVDDGRVTATAAEMRRWTAR